MNWNVIVTGDDSILDGLSSSHTRSSTITKNGNEYILHLEEFSNCNSASEVKEAAAQYIDVLNGILFLQDDLATAIKINSIIRKNETAGRDIFIFPEPAVIELRGYAPTITVTNESGETIVNSPYENVFENVGKTRSHEKLLKIFKEIKYGDFEFPTLSKIIEVLFSLKGAELYKWVPKSKIDLLMHTSQEYRHGVIKHQPPAKPMTLNEAQEITKLLLKKYIAELNK